MAHLQPIEPIGLVSIESGKRDDAAGTIRVESEKAILAGILLGPDCFPVVSEQIRPEMFTRRDHRAIFAAMEAVWTEHGTVDISLIHQKLQDSGKKHPSGWGKTLAALTQSMPLAGEVHTHLATVHAAWLRRELAGRISKLTKRMSDPAADPFEAVEALASEAADLGRKRTREGVDDYASGVSALGHYLEDTPTTAKPLLTGFLDIDKETGGFLPGAYVAIAGRTGVGKSILSLCLARQMAALGAHVAFMALEMTNREAFCRIVSAVTSVPTSVLLARKTDRWHWERIMAHIGEIEGLRLKTFDRVRSLTDIRRTARALKSAGRLDVLIVDTVHLVTESGGAYDKSLAVSNGLRSLAIELDIVVVGICQFKGGYDEGEQGSKRPQRHWIKDGTHMIQDPTDILLLHRPDPLAPKVEVIFDKRRHGKPGRIVDLMLREEFARYDNWSNR